MLIGRGRHSDADTACKGQRDDPSMAHAPDIQPAKGLEPNGTVCFGFLDVAV